jgi:hypothetical protein
LNRDEKDFNYCTALSPSNLAAVHRSRLFMRNIYPLLDGKPFILTVDEQHYEERLDWNLYKLLPTDQHRLKR